MDNDGEAKLIKRAKKGDKDAVGELYDRNYDPVFRYISYRVAQQTTAEDLTTDVFLRMIENLDTYQHRGRPILAWLYSIAKNLVIDHYRQEGETDPLPLKDELLAGDHASPPDVIKKDQSQACFRRALYHLTESQRRVIIHKFIEERTTMETARIMDKSEPAIRSLQFRALEALEKALKKEKCI